MKEQEEEEELRVWPPKKFQVQKIRCYGCCTTTCSCDMRGRERGRWTLRSSLTAVMDNGQYRDDAFKLCNCTYKSRSWREGSAVLNLCSDAAACGVHNWKMETIHEMPRYSRNRAAGLGKQDSRETRPFPAASEQAHNTAHQILQAATLPDVDPQENGRFSSPTCQDSQIGISSCRRASSTNDTNFKKHPGSQQLRSESIPELSLDDPPEDDSTWHAEWADAVKKVQTLRKDGPQGSNGRWSVVVADNQRPRTWTAPQETKPNKMTTEHAPRGDQWKITEPSFLQKKETALWQDSLRQRSPCRKSSLGVDAYTLPRAMSLREEKGSWSRSSGSQQGRGAKSITTFDLMPAVKGRRAEGTFETTIPLRETIQPGEAPCVNGLQTRGSGGQQVPPLFSPNFAERSRRHAGLSLNHGSRSRSEGPHSDSDYSAQVHKTQSFRHDRHAARILEEKSLRREKLQGDVNVPAAVMPRPIMQKALSMREGGAHADAVTQMARAYSELDGVLGHRILECASCGRELGVIVQGNPGADMSFCQACQPSVTHPTSKPAAVPKKKKNGLVNFCRKMLRLDSKKQSQAQAWGSTLSSTPLTVFTRCTLIKRLRVLSCSGRWSISFSFVLPFHRTCENIAMDWLALWLCSRTLNISHPASRADVLRG